MNSIKPLRKYTQLWQDQMARFLAFGAIQVVQFGLRGEARGGEPASATHRCVYIYIYCYYDLTLAVACVESSASPVH